MLFNKLLALSCAIKFVTALEPTKVQVKLSSTNTNWTVANVPKTTTPNTPDFSFMLTSTGAAAPIAQPTWSAKGSLGFPRHPLGLLNFHANGSACGKQTIEIMDGILGEATVDFPPCPWPASALNVPVRVRVWTVIPAIPPLFSTGFEVQIALAGAADLPSVQIDLVQPPKSGASKGQDVCQTDKMDPSSLKYPPTDDFEIPTVQVNLDDPAETRWDPVVKPRAHGISKLIDTFVHNAPINNTLLKILLDIAGSGEMKRMPQDYVKEIKGIGKSTGLDFAHIWIINMMYEISGLCTSLVAQDANGKVWHARNLDFGLFNGDDPATHTWALTETLKAILVNVEFTRGGKVLYHGTTYAGFVGLLSGSRDNGFGITVNTRYDTNLDAGLIRWLTGKNDDTKFLTFQTRQVMENCSTYAEAYHALTTYKPLGPAYIIVSGTNSGEGAIVAKKYNKTAQKAGIPWDTNEDIWNLTESLGKGSFYVLETNYDRRYAPPGFDDRRFPAENCLDSLGAAGVTPESLWGVMSSNPTRNALTTFTTIMSPGASYFRAYKQKCIPGPNCSPF